MAAKVFFTAVADHGGDFGPFQTDKTLVFNTNITNITNMGDGYDNTSGVFKAPVKGVYYFTFSYHAGKGAKSGLSLVKNGSVMTQAFDDQPKGDNIVDNAGNSAFLELQEGDKVFVRLPANCQVWASNNTTTFSGFLVCQ